MPGLMAPAAGPVPYRPLMAPTAAGAPIGLRALLWAYVAVFAVVLAALQTLDG